MIKSKIKWYLGFFVIVLSMINQISCTRKNDNQTQIVSNQIKTNPTPNSESNSPCDDSGGEVDNFGIVGGKTISQKSPLARGVVQILIKFYNQLNDKNLGGATCTGALLDSNIILTAAHCVDIPDEMKGIKKSNIGMRIYILEGSNPFCRLNRGDTSKTLKVDKFIFNKNYNSDSGGSDIALLRTEKPVSDVGHHTFYKLDAQTHDFKEDETLIAIGYGHNKGYSIKDEIESPLKIAFLKSNKSDRFLNEYTQRLMTQFPNDKKDELYLSWSEARKKTNKTYARIEYDEYLFNLFKTGILESKFPYSDSNENLLFDQSNNESICAGDSGGPGLRAAGNTLRIVGVTRAVSAHQTGSESCSFAAYYTNVSFHKQWIINTYNELVNEYTYNNRQGESLFQ